MPTPIQPQVRIVAVDGARRIPLSVPVFPPAEPAASFQIVDGATLTAYQHGTQPEDVTFGEGNHGGQAAPGDSFAVVFPEGEYPRAAERFSNDVCVDNSVRGSDTWSTVTVHYALPSIRSDCQPGHAVHMLACVPVPSAPPSYYAIAFPGVVSE